ncbi:TadE/TadG family type IV pilus assembly protein [Streptomyces sp. NPDC058662]|uniref:TadE/TadG family type IV pilus assembly protein n=1 Tax=Streptomyces sp. NPDC058662 TaxID=3346583 RepID=UPI00364C864A
MPASAPADGSAGRPGRGGDRGQVAIEFVGMLPLILLLVAAVWEGVLIGYAFSLAGNAADEAARAGAVHGAAECDAAAKEHIGSAWSVRVSCGPAGNLYKAEVSLRVPVLVPGLDTGLRIDGHGGAAKEQE